MPPSCALLCGFAIGERVALLCNITRTRNVSEYMLVLALCLVGFGESERVIDEESGESADEVVTGARRGMIEQSGSMDQWVMGQWVNGSVGHGSMGQWVMG